MPPFLLILESFGTSELLLILVVALIFFGPRKLPQLSRQIGKSLAEFKRASDDFKRTWEREVALDTPRAESEPGQTILPQNNSLAETTVGRGQPNMPLPDEGYATNLESNIPSDGPELAQAEPPPASPKRDWL